MSEIRLDKEVTLAGKLLIAMPGISDPRFDKTVTLLCHHDREGCMGLILNRPNGRIGAPEIASFLDISVEEIENQDLVVHNGGPVDIARGFILHSTEYDKGHESAVLPGCCLSLSMETLQDIATGKGPKSYFLALGYAGWGAGQLEQEMTTHGWLLADATTSLIFSTPDELKWSQALASLGIDSNMLSANSGNA